MMGGMSDHPRERTGLTRRLRGAGVVGAWLVAWLPLPAGAQVDYLDPYGLQPKPPPAAPAPAPKSQPQPASPTALEASPDSKKGLTPDQVEQAFPNAERDRAREAAQALQKELQALMTAQGGIPMDRLGPVLPAIPSFRVGDVLEDPTIFEGQRMKVTGHVRRECKTGCWAEIAPFRTAPAGVRVIPPGGNSWSFVPSRHDRQLTAYGLLKKRQLSAKEARALDAEAGEKPASGARVEWYLEAEGAEVLWLE
jgi:hypothetical protein